MPAETAHRRATRSRLPARRVSGPLRAAPAGTPLRRGTTGVFERLRALPETRVVDGLLRGRAWIWLIGLLLGGIVAMQVSLLKLNAGISRAVTTAATLERLNAGLEADIAKLSSGDRVEDAAAANGMVTPPAGGVEYLTARPDRDPSRAARRMTPPSDEAAAVMENGGREPGVAAAPTTAPVDPATATPAAGATAATTAPAAAATPAPVATATPVPTPEPTVTPAADTGAAVVPGEG
jgi:hypothetical protein